MKIKFTAKPLGRPEFKIGQELEFHGRDEAYGRKYIDRGWAEDITPPVSVTEVQSTEADEAAAAAAAEAARLQAEADKLKARSEVVIPDDVAELSFVDLRALAVQLTDEPIRSKDDAIKAIEIEANRRAS
ncbi:hypothetical protein C8D77_101217 [Mesorhizobium loti]|uniref:Uncharacterized protein n=1 Tax=Rhizobium loti TaxID=381 RepID=A0A8E2WFK9_RHILI|nr:hypothetical protein [Mesorhizobium loti]PWJ93538.1 hypothetical protein C8D77_101217 [Mesorhizobium loti]